MIIYMPMGRCFRARLLSLSLILCAGLTLAALAAPVAPKILFPEDLGPDQIDVSSYPSEYQDTYKKIFVPVFWFLGGTARAINSPIIEMDTKLETSERKGHSEIFADAALATVSRDGWKKRVEEIRRRPPCCGACPVLTRKDARALWCFLVYDSIARKTGPRALAWVALRQGLLDRFKKEYPQRFEELYPQKSSSSHGGV